MKYDYQQFIQLLDPDVRYICGTNYGDNSPYAKIEEAEYAMLEGQTNARSSSRMAT
jgi:hypothetical protein